jgi:hypothetical protein
LNVEPEAEFHHTGGTPKPMLDASVGSARRSFRRLDSSSVA